MPPPLTSWLAAVRKELEAAAAVAPTEPGDWSRPAEVGCTCQYCAQLNAFLRDATQEVGRIPAREDMRDHVTHMITRHRCDVKHALERKGSPYSLLLTKTNGSYDRAVRRYKTDRRLLCALPSIGDD